MPVPVYLFCISLMIIKKLKIVDLSSDTDNCVLSDIINWLEDLINK